MGWDAYSSAKRDFKNDKLEDATLDEVFKKASAEVKKKTGSVDALLSLGGLDCSACGSMLENATGESVYPEIPWSADIVKRLNTEAKWDFQYEPEETWAYWSAKLFLEICAKHGLSISFSY